MSTLHQEKKIHFSISRPSLLRLGKKSYCLSLLPPASCCWLTQPFTRSHNPASQSSLLRVQCELCCHPFASLHRESPGWIRFPDWYLVQPCPGPSIPVIMGQASFALLMCPGTSVLGLMLVTCSKFYFSPFVAQHPGNVGHTKLAKVFNLTWCISSPML